MVVDIVKSLEEGSKTKAVTHAVVHLENKGTPVRLEVWDQDEPILGCSMEIIHFLFSANQVQEIFFRSDILSQLQNIWNLLLPVLF